MDIMVIATFLIKLSEFGKPEFELFIEAWFWLDGVTLMANGNVLKNAKCEG